MSRKDGGSIRGWWLAALLAAVGCGGPLEEEEVQEVSAQSEALQADCTPHCKPAFPVKNSPVLSPYPSIDVLTPFKEKVYFLAPTVEGGPTALWRSNATGSGTYPIYANVSSPLMKAGELLYFARGGSLWASDGTTHGTRAVKSLEGGRPISTFQDVRGRLFFALTYAEDSRRELWVSDGSPAGTRRLAVFPTVQPYTLSQMAEFRGRLFFTAATEARGMELWSSDGTPGGTRLFKDIAPGTASSEPWQLTVACGALYFVANDQVHGQELWTTQSLDPARTYMVRDFVPGPNWSYTYALAGLHGDLYFTLHPADQFSDVELWRTDGSSHGTVRVKRFASPDPVHTELWSQLGRAAGNRIYFVVQPLSATGPGAGNAQLWSTDGTPEGTRYLTEPLSSGDEGPIVELFAVDRSLLFAASDHLPYGDPRQRGRELWASQGTPSKTHLLQDLLPGPGSSNPSSFALAGRYVYFLAEDASFIYRLWALPVESVRSNAPLH